MRNLKELYGRVFCNFVLNLTYTLLVSEIRVGRVDIIKLQIAGETSDFSFRSLSCFVSKIFSLKDKRFHEF